VYDQSQLDFFLVDWEKSRVETAGQGMGMGMTKRKEETELELQEKEINDVRNKLMDNSRPPAENIIDKAKLLAEDMFGVNLDSHQEKRMEKYCHGQ
jgi:hypothetical protein